MEMSDRQVAVKVTGIGASTLTGNLNARHELSLHKVYEQTASGSAIMKVAGHILNMQTAYPFAKSITLEFRDSSGLSTAQKEMLRNHVQKLCQCSPRTALYLVGL